MQAAILTIGSELLRGDIQDRNSSWLCGRLTERGVAVLTTQTVDDVDQAIASAARDLAQRAELVLVTGGLGPTQDDRTSAALAAAFGRSLERDPAMVETLGQRFAHWNLAFTEAQRKQAERPQGAQWVANARGTAPGLSLDLSALEPAKRWRAQQLFAFPGPPSEMQPMFEAAVLPWLDQHLAAGSRVVGRLQTFGWPEAKLAEALAEVDGELRALPERPLSLSYRIRFPEVELTLSSTIAVSDPARWLERIRACVEPVVYDEHPQGYPGAVGALLATQGRTLAIAESCTGGLLGEMLTRAPGSSRYFLMGVVTYSNHAKTSLLGVDPRLLESVGAVSEEVAVAMAQGVRERATADFGLAVTGIAGPEGGSESKPVGTVFVALAGKDPTQSAVRRLSLTGDRGRIRTLAAYRALATLRQAVLGRVQSA